MKRRRALEQRIFFPWEGRGGLWRRLGLGGRARPVLAVALLGAFVIWVGARERQAAGVRSTRATLSRARVAVDRYLAEHEGGCPATLGHLVEATSLNKAPVDAWGRPLRLVCPGRREGSAYELMSDGPDGQPGGLDRIE